MNHPLLFHPVRFVSATFVAFIVGRYRIYRTWLRRKSDEEKRLQKQLVARLERVL
jgi:hypothetical protein